MLKIHTALQRTAITFGELLVELLLFGTYLGILLVPDDPVAIMTAVIPVFAVLLSVGYYFTRPLLGLCWGRHKPWLYAAFCGILFVIHMYVGYLGNRSGMSSRAHNILAPYLIGGWAIAAATAFLGRHMLRKWSTQSKLGRSELNSET